MRLFSDAEHHNDTAIHAGRSISGIRAHFVGHPEAVTETMAQASTRLLRAGAEPLYARLRDLLSMKGVDPSTCVLAAFFPDDTNMEFGVVVTPDRHVYEFDLFYGPGDLKHAVDGAYLGGWRDRTDWWASTPSRTDIEEAMAMLDRA